MSDNYPMTKENIDVAVPTTEWIAAVKICVRCIYNHANLERAHSDPIEHHLHDPSPACSNSLLGARLLLSLLGLLGVSFLLTINIEDILRNAIPLSLVCACTKQDYLIVDLDVLRRHD